MNDTYVCDYCKRELTKETGHIRTKQHEHPFHVDLCGNCVVENLDKLIVEVSYED